jgi:hypothetical protein
MQQVIGDHEAREAYEAAIAEIPATPAVLTSNRPLTARAGLRSRAQSPPFCSHAGLVTGPVSTPSSLIAVAGFVPLAVVNNWLATGTFEAQNVPVTAPSHGSYR